jgi:PTH1 family peptidyl-tRNA hydrolase
MKLFVWLWNPWEKYASTRHNAWVIALEQLCSSEWCTNFLYQKKFFADTATWLVGKRQIIAAIPQTYMNKSWQSISSLASYYNINPNDILVLQDDIDLPFWKLKLKFGGSHGGHNGIRDTISRLWTEKFWRLKIWVWRPSHPWQDVVEYVLQNFSSTEQKWLRDHEPAIREKVGAYLKNTG